MNIQQRKDFVINFLYVAIISLLCIFGFKYCFKILSPFIFAFLLELCLYPLVNKIHKKTNTKKSIIAVTSTIVTLILLLFFIILGVSFAINTVPVLTGMITNFIGEYLPVIVDKLTVFIDKIEDIINIQLSTEINIVDILKTELINSLSGVSTWLLGWSTKIVSGFPNFFLNTLIMIISSIFMALTGEDIAKFVNRFINQDKENKFNDIIKTIMNKMGKILKGYLLIILLTFSELSFAFSILGINNAFTYAFIISLFDILPLAGVGGILIPAVITNFVLGNTGLAIGLLITYIIITFVRQAVEPMLIGSILNISNPLVTLAAMIVGLKIGGLVLMLGLPLFVGFFNEFYLSKKLDEFENAIKRNPKTTKITMLDEK